MKTRELYMERGEREQAYDAWNRLLKLWSHAEGPAALEVRNVERLLSAK